MASITTNAPRSAPVDSQDLHDPALKPLWIALGAIGLAFLFGGPAWFSAMYNEDHYSFALIVPLASAYLLWYRQPSLKNLTPGSTGLSLLGFALAGLFVFDSLLTGSTTNWAIALVLSATSLVYLGGGKRLLRGTWPALVLLLLIIRPPFSLDKNLADGLQLWVSGQASSILDLMKVPHCREGNIIHLADQPLMVEEACSGINSLFATGAVLIFAMLLLRRPLAHELALFAFGFLAVLAVNVFRVVALTWMHHYSARLGEIIDMWLPHMAFGMACFALLLILLYSADALLYISIDRLWYVLPAPLMLRLRWLTGAEDPLAEETQAAQPQQESNSPEPEPEPGIPLPAAVQTRSATWKAVTVMFAGLAALQLVVVGMAMARGEANVELPAGDPLQGQLAGALPPEWNGWVQRGPVEDQQHLKFIEANYSAIWQYEKGGQVAYIYVHRPYRGFHYLQACYAGSDWTVDNRASAIVDNPGLQYVMYDIERKDEGQHALAFTFADLANREWMPPPAEMQSFDLSQRARNSLAYRAKKLGGLFHRKQRADTVAAGLVVRIETTRPEREADRTEAVEMLTWAARRLFPDYQSTVP